MKQGTLSTLSKHWGVLWGQKNGPLEDPRVRLHNRHRIKLESTVGWIGFTFFRTLQNGFITLKVNAS